MTGIYAIYALSALLIPLIIEWIKKYTTWIPGRLLPVLPPVLGFVTVFLTQLSLGPGVGFIAALQAALSSQGLIDVSAVGGGAAMIRQIATRTVKKPT